MKQMKNNELYNIKDVLDYQIFTTSRYSPLTYQELYQLAYMGYLKAQKNFNPEYGKMSLVYASKYIKQELIAANRREYKYSNKMVHMTNPQDQEEGYSDNFIEEQPDNIEEKQNITASPLVGKIADLLDLLHPKQAEILHDYYLADKPKRLVDIAKEKGVSKQRIHQLKQKGLDRIKELLDEEGTL
jgi:RNA polymerase sigma factor (sigma-70 family)